MSITCGRGAAIAGLLWAVACCSAARRVGRAAGRFAQRVPGDRRSSESTRRSRRRPKPGVAWSFPGSISATASGATSGCSIRRSLCPAIARWNWTTAGLKLSDRCRDNFIRSGQLRAGDHPDRAASQYPHPRHRPRGAPGRRSSPRHRRQRQGRSAREPTAPTRAWPTGARTGDWRNIGILLAFVEDFSIENLTVEDSHAWAISLERCAHGRLRDLDFASSGFKMIDGKRETILNQDGIDLRLGCHDILIENVTGYTGDDLGRPDGHPEPQQRGRRHGVDDGQRQHEPRRGRGRHPPRHSPQRPRATAAAGTTSSAC